MTVQYPTQPQLKYNFQAYLQAQNSNINSFATNSSWDILAGANSLMFLDLYANLQTVENGYYPQNYVGDQCDWGLYARGLPARGNTTFAIILCTSSSSEITAGTVFVSNETGASFIAIANITVGSVPFALYSDVAGAGYLEAVGNALVGNGQTVTVVSSTDGQNQESDQSCINRILTYDRQPTAGARETDYQNYALAYNQTLSYPVITQSIPIPNFTQINNVYTFGLFVTAGSSTISEYQLNLGLLPNTNFSQFSQQVDSTIVNGVNNYIQALRLVGQTFIIGTTVTNPVTSTSAQLNISISLISSLAGIDITEYSITINSQDQNDNPIQITLTIEQLIQREARRAICNQSLNPTLIGGQNYITLNSISEVINSQLSANGGQLAQILTNLSISGSDIEVPNYDFNGENIYYTYDIDSYSNVIITQVK